MTLAFVIIVQDWYLFHLLQRVIIPHLNLSLIIIIIIISCFKIIIHLFIEFVYHTAGFFYLCQEGAC